MSGATRELLFCGVHALRRSAIWWTIGIASFSVINAAFWPSFENSDALKAFEGMSEGLLEAFGAQDFASPSGYMDAQLYALLLPLLLSGMAIAGATLITAGDEDAGRLELLHALPISRRALWLTRFASSMLVVVLVTAVTALLVAATLPVFSLEEISTVRILAATFACGALAVFHASVGYALAGFGASRGLAVGGGVLVMVAGYVLSVLLPISDALTGSRNLSPWYWTIGDQPVTHGIDGLRLLLTVVATAVLVTAGTVAVTRRDIHTA